MEMRGGEAGNLEKRAWKKKMETKSKAPHVKPTCWAPQFVFALYVRATRPFVVQTALEKQLSGGFFGHGD